MPTFLSKIIISMILHSSLFTFHSSLQQLSHRLSAFVLLSFCKFCMLLGATLLYGGHYLESAVAADFLQCPDGSAALVHQYIERPGCGGGAQQRTALASLQWQRETHDILAHQAIHHTVEKQLERAGDIAPVAGRCHHKGIGSAYHGKHTLSIVLGLCGSACSPYKVLRRGCSLSPPLPQLPAARLLSLSFPPSARCFPWLADWH